MIAQPISYLPENKFIDNTVNVKLVNLPYEDDIDEIIENVFKQKYPHIGLKLSKVLNLDYSSSLFPNKEVNQDSSITTKKNAPTSENELSIFETINSEPKAIPPLRSFKVMLHIKKVIKVQ